MNRSITQILLVAALLAVPAMVHAEDAAKVFKAGAATAKAGPKGDTSKLAIDGIKKIDAQSFSIKLTKPNPLFLFSLAASSTSVVPPAPDFLQQPPGAGQGHAQQVGEEDVFVALVVGELRRAGQRVDRGTPLRLRHLVLAYEAVEMAG